MKKINISQGMTAFVDDEDFDRTNKFNWFAYKNKRAKTYYAKRRDHRVGKTISMHYFITGYKGLDHKDGNGLNNQKSNLRMATLSQNGANKFKSKNNKSGYKGVCFYNKSKLKPWKAQITKDKKKIYLGCFATKEEAHEAYKVAAIELHGEFAKW